MQAKNGFVPTWLAVAIIAASIASAAAPEDLPVRIGKPVAVENLTVFPVQGEHADQPIALTTLEGPQAIYVLADAVVKGGQQDRQISRTS